MNMSLIFMSVSAVLYVVKTERGKGGLWSEYFLYIRNRCEISASEVKKKNF